jgi:hypothetical protein
VDGAKALVDSKDLKQNGFENFRSLVPIGNSRSISKIMLSRPKVQGHLKGVDSQGRGLRSESNKPLTLGQGFITRKG